jgi:O-acetyl-ADP-ribose deacetylase (regulator of RNase III)
MIHTINGNLLDATEQYIVQQCNCISTKPHGLSKSISDKWKHGDLYGKRESIKGRNLACEGSRSVPGTIEVLGNGKEQRYIICAFGQYGMGKPYTYNNTCKQWIDGTEERLKWFYECLQAISGLEPESIAFPYFIACGLAGGNWEQYSHMIQQFAEQNPKTKVVLYKLKSELSLSPCTVKLNGSNHS